jgi:hypothetical protein
MRRDEIQGLEMDEPFFIQRTCKCFLYDKVNTVNTLGRPTYLLRLYGSGMSILHVLVPPQKRAGGNTYLFEPLATYQFVHRLVGILLL